MDERISNCWMVELVRIAWKRHNMPIIPLREHYIDGYVPAEENDGWHQLQYHIRPDKKGTAYSVAKHYYTKEVIY